MLLWEMRGLQCIAWLSAGWGPATGRCCGAVELLLHNRRIAVAVLQELHVASS
jgi:hypothetical protein